MFNSNEKFQTVRHSSATTDMGLRSYFLRVYNYMFLGLGVTAVMAYFAVRLPFFQQLLFTITPEGYATISGFTWLLFFAEIGLVMYLSARVHTMSVAKAQTIFWIYAGLSGITLAPICLAYTSASLFRTFLVTAATFGSMSLYGYTTKKDLSGMGSFFMMGLIGLIIASVVNMFMQSSMMDFVISAFGVLLFTGLAAYDTQRIKALYFEGDSDQTAGQKAVMGALTLYLDFINLFLFLLRFLGDRR